MAKEYLGQEYAAATNGKGLAQESRWVRIVTRLTVTVSVVVMLFSAAIVICCGLFFLSPIIGTSMMTTLNATGKDTDSAVGCRVTTLERGAVVISKLYQHQSHDVAMTDQQAIKEHYPNFDFGGRYVFIIKRVIALGGDQITMTRTPNPQYNYRNADYNYDYTIYLNGEELKEPYLDPGFGKANGCNFVQLYNILHNQSRAELQDWLSTDLNDCVKDGVLTIPQGYYFLMGDNRGGNVEVYPEYSHSWDSSKIGPLPANQYMGTCLEVVDTSVNLPRYVWDKVVYYVFFGWAWQKWTN